MISYIRKRFKISGRAQSCAYSMGSIVYTAGENAIVSTILAYSPHAFGLICAKRVMYNLNGTVRCVIT